MRSVVNSSAKRRSAVVLALSFVACSAARVETQSPLATRAVANTPDAEVTDAIAIDATSSTRPLATTVAINDSGVRPSWSGPPTSFAEVLDGRRPVYWRLEARGSASCRAWTPTVVDEATHTVVLETSMRQRCVEYYLQVPVRLLAPDQLELSGIGAGTRSRTGGSGWRRGGSQHARTISWVSVSDERIATSEGDWYLNREACERETNALPTTPVLLSVITSDDISRRLASVSSLEQLRWMAAYVEDGPAPERIVRGVAAVLRDRATVWEATEDGGACRSWTVAYRDTRIQLSRTTGTGAARRTHIAGVRFDLQCGELQYTGCAVEDGRGSSVDSAPSRPGTWWVDAVGEGWLRVGQMMLFTTRAACMQNPERRLGPLVIEC